MSEKQAADYKRMKAQGKEVTWFDMYIELKSEMQGRIFKLEERVKRLEAEND